MNIRLLTIFKAVCDAGGVSRAAVGLFMTQPAVSHAIRELERETGLVLFDRLARKMLLTESGRLFLDKAERLLELSAELDRGAAALEREAPLRLASCITIACFWLPRLMQKFAATCPNPCTVQVASAEAVLAALRRNDVDIALYEGVPPAAPFTAISFASYRLSPVCPPSHPFAGREVGLDDLLGEKLLLRETGSAIRDVFDSHLRLRRRQARPTMTSVNSQALIQAVAAGAGVGVLPEVVVAEAITAGNLAAFTVKGMRLTNENSVVFHRDKSLTAAMCLFIDLARKGRNARRR